MKCTQLKKRCQFTSNYRAGKKHFTLNYQILPKFIKNHHILCKKFYNSHPCILIIIITMPYCYNVSLQPAPQLPWHPTTTDKSGQIHPQLTQTAWTGVSSAPHSRPVNWTRKSRSRSSRTSILSLSHRSSHAWPNKGQSVAATVRSIIQPHIHIRQLRDV